MSSVVTTVQELRVEDLRDIVIGEIVQDPSTGRYYRTLQLLGDPLPNGGAELRVMLRMVVSSATRQDIQVSFPSGEY